MERLINFDPQWINDIVITGINIFILFFVMSYFLFNPAREVLEKRRKRIAGDLETAKTSREDALALKAEYEDKIKSIDKEAQEILDAARKKAKKQEADILAEAREFRNGSPYDPKNAGLRADIAIPHYDYITAGSEYNNDPRFRNCSFTRVLEIMKGIVKP